MIRKIVYSEVVRRVALTVLLTMAGTMLASGREARGAEDTDSVASRQLREVTVTGQGARQRFARAVDRAAACHRMLTAAAPEPAEARTAADCIIVKADRRFVRIRPDGIRYVEGLKDYVIVHLEERRIVTRMTIKELLDLLPPGQFLRVSRSFVVNRRFVDAFDNRDVIVCGTEIAIGATYRDAVLASLLG